VAEAYNDINGIHVYASVSSAGYETATSEAARTFTDTITNNSGVAADFQIGFNVDGYAASTIQDSVVGAQNFESAVSGANLTSTTNINQDYLTDSNRAPARRSTRRMRLRPRPIP
jgi:hypothetical protein